MLNYDAIFIGWGKGAKTLAQTFASKGKKIAMVEKKKEMAGGTCINIACIPTKVLVTDAEKGISFESAMKRKDTVVEKLNQSNYQKLAGEEQVDIYFATASFQDNQTVVIEEGDDRIEARAEYIFIDTGAEGNIPPIEGLADTKHVYDSTSIQHIPTRPRSLLILGAGNIGLEFASIYANFGTRVMLVESGDKLLPREEPEIREAATEVMKDQGIEIALETSVVGIKNDGEEVVLITENGQDLRGEALLIAVGRKPNTKDLKLENTSIALTENGGIQTNEFLETSVPNIFALGDVRGEEQFTYTSLDDFRIIANYLEGDKSYSLNERKNVPYTIFIDPPLARIGISEEEAIKTGKEIFVQTVPVASMPRGHVNGDTRGMFKAVVDSATEEILGVTLFGENAHEVINLIKIVMDHHLPYTTLRDQIFTHPTMAENLNDLFKW